MPKRWLAASLMVLLLAVWLGGGVTQDSTSADEILELLSLPVIALAAWMLLSNGVDDRLQRTALWVMALVVLVPLLQLLPWPGTGAGTAWRQQLLDDLVVAGVQAPRLRWSLAPTATERGLWSLLPAIAAFLAALALDAPQRRWALKWLLLLVAGNIAFAFFQAGLPLDSPLRLFQGFDSRFGGLFANTNHQATALLIGMVLATGQAIHARRRGLTGHGRPGIWLWYAGFAAACLLIMPFTTSRAGMVLAFPALAATLVMSGAVRPRRLRSPRMLAGALVVVVLVLVGLRAASGWMEVDRLQELRHILAATTLQLGSQQAPWGSGMGSFVSVFEQGAPSQLWLDVYVNHAHNEYAQWWLETGWLGMLALACVLAVLGVAGWRAWRMHGRSGDAVLAVSCLVAVLVALVHSWVDYPLRTLSLMATTASLVGLLLGAVADSRPRDTRLRLRHRSDTDMQSA